MGLNDIILGLAVGLYFIGLGAGIKGMLPDNLRGNKLLLGFGVLIILGNVAIAFANKKVADHRVTPQEIVASVSNRINLPLQMDAMLRLETLVAGADRVHYNFSVAADSLPAFQQKIADQRDFMKKNGCTMKDSQLLFRSGFGLQMNFSAPMKIGGMEEKIVIMPKDCGFAEAPSVPEQKQ